jgi:type II secretory ATPase GspE/PulE/Tfp pilus assembly ATPase PilB-like protein
MKGSDASRLTDAARRNGMHQLREDGWTKVKAGITTAEEVTRVTQEF